MEFCAAGAKNVGDEADETVEQGAKRGNNTNKFVLKMSIPYFGEHSFFFFLAARLRSC